MEAACFAPNIYEFKELIERQALDFVQPDICCCRGVLTMKKIAALAEVQYILVAPHNPMSPLATAINVHFAASRPNFFILEYAAPDSGARKSVLKEPLMVRKDGYVDIPNKPGWGMELNEEAFRSMPPAPMEATQQLPCGRLSIISIDLSARRGRRKDRSSISRLTPAERDRDASFRPEIQIVTEAMPA